MDPLRSLYERVKIIDEGIPFVEYSISGPRRPKGYFTEELVFASPKVKAHIRKKHNYYYFIEDLSAEYQRQTALKGRDLSAPNLLHLVLDKPITVQWEERIGNILRFVRLFQEFYGVKRGLNLVIIPTSLKKMLPLKKGQIIGPNEVNSGSTTFRGGQAEFITIWRREELEKVLIHELIHYYDLDKGIEDRQYQEAFVEALANILYQTMRTIVELEPYGQLVADLNTESDFAQAQLAKLWRYWYPDAPPTIVNHRCPIPKSVWGKVSPNTSPVGYYWIKAALLWDLSTDAQRQTAQEGQDLSTDAQRQTALKGRDLSAQEGRDLSTDAQRQTAQEGQDLPRFLSFLKRIDWKMILSDPSDPWDPARTQYMELAQNALSDSEFQSHIEALYHDGINNSRGDRTLRMTQN